MPFFLGKGEQDLKSNISYLVERGLGFATGDLYKAGPDITEPAENTVEMWAELHKPGVGKILICKICGFTHPYTSAMKTHMRKHTGEKPYKCDVCGRRFTTKGNMKSHMITHVT